MTPVIALWGVTLFYLLGLTISLLSSINPWKIARYATLAALLASVTLILMMPFFPDIAALADPTGLTLMLLTTFLSWVITQYAKRYLSGEPNQRKFVQAILFTFLCVSAIAVTQNLLIIILAWSGTSIGLHSLLTYYSDRKAAMVVAHKKFIVSRLAEITSLAAVYLIYQEIGSLSLHDINSALQAVEQLPAGLNLAAVLLVVAAILKTAQLPLHGWLIQVMEAPTPVSALLHAGVVNLGGFVLIRLGELISLSMFSQALLVVVGGLTAVLAGIVMMTRISIKVRLAWSTCAQMGFMLMEIGLGLYELALLHLVAHSLYKAYAFLNSGETVSLARQSDLFSKALNTHSLPIHLFGLVMVSALMLLSASLWTLLAESLHLSLPVYVILTLGLTPLMLGFTRLSLRNVMLSGCRVVFLIQLYMLWHLLFLQLAPAPSNSPVALWVWVCVLFLAFYTLQMHIKQRPNSPLVKALYPWAYNGFYLDETFTRITFKYWPVKLTRAQARTRAN